MANEEHLAILAQGVEAWNQWRRANPEVVPDLGEAHLLGADLAGADLSGVRLWGAELSRADLSDANLARAVLTLTELWKANLQRVDLSGADLNRANLSGADLTDADVSGADLYGAQLVSTTVEGADLSGATVYGTAVWSLKGEPKRQRDLVISPFPPRVTVDDLEMAQFIWLLIDNARLRRVIDTITSKVVLILGRFTEERKQVLYALRNQLRTRNLTPVLFDFDVPADRDITETVTLLARMARFIVADLTDPASIPMELQAIAPDVAVPIRSIVHQGQEPFSMFTTLKKYHWVLPPYEYGTLDELLRDLDEQVIAPSEAKRVELTGDHSERSPIRP